MTDQLIKIPVSEENLRDALHELIGFIAGCSMLDQEKKLAMELPSVKYCAEPRWLIPVSTTVMEIKK